MGTRRQPGSCRLRASLLLWALACGPFSAPALAAGPLHEQIDQAIEAKASGPRAALSTDAEFVRRAYLDLAGMIPTAAEAKAFVDDPSPYKRERLMDRLLADPAYARRMQYVFDGMLMERRPDLHVPEPQWQAYLLQAFLENRPYNELIAEILSVDGLDPATRPAAKFLLDREAQPNLLTRDIGRLFLGVDLQCCQCHDHPLIDDYKQAHYYGLFAFLSRTSLFNDEAKKMTVLAEKAEGDVTFTSVFKKKVSHKTGPRVLDGKPVDEPSFPAGHVYFIKPADKVRPVPCYSRRAQLAPLLTSGAVPEFNRNIVNRLWALLMGRGLVHPLDMHHSDNPPSHPELLDLLAREFVAMHFDIKAFLRELALTRTYQRSSEPPPGASAELSDPTRFAVAAVKPLSSDQMAWSVMQAVGLVGSARQSAEHRLEVQDPRMRDILHTDAKRQVLRGRMLEDAVYESLKGNVAPFDSQFAGAAGQPQDATEPTVHQALFLANGEPIQSWLAPSGNTLVGRLVPMTDASMVAEELYLSILSRRPTGEERTEVTEFLAQHKDQRPQALRELAWALLASSEFRFNH